MSVDSTNHSLKHYFPCMTGICRCGGPAVYIFLYHFITMDLSISGFWYSWGSWNQSSVSFPNLKVLLYNYHHFINEAIEAQHVWEIFQGYIILNGGTEFWNQATLILGSVLLTTTCHYPSYKWWFLIKFKCERHTIKIDSFS